MHFDLLKNWAVNHWIKQGMPKEKISMGLATYGRTFKLFKNSSAGIRVSSFGPGEPGKYTRESGFLAFYEVKRKKQLENVRKFIHHSNIILRFVKN